VGLIKVSGIVMSLYPKSVGQQNLLDLCRISEHAFCGSRVDTREQADGHTGQAEDTGAYLELSVTWKAATV